MSNIYFRIYLNTNGNIRYFEDPTFRDSEARKRIKFFLAPDDADVIVSDEMVPDYLVSDSMVERFLSVEPPLMRSILEFDTIIKEIERAYVLGAFVSAVSNSVVTIERLLNVARIELHHHASPKIKKLWGKGPSNAWQENIDALLQWGFIGDDLAKELSALYEIRCQYLHSSSLANLEADALRCVRGAYAFLKQIIGFPDHLFAMNNGAIECLDMNSPLFKVFYAPSIIEEGGNTEPEPGAE
jgi:hypothetical protein